MRVRWMAAVALIAVLAPLSVAQKKRAAHPPTTPPAVRDFDAKVGQYVAQRKQQAGSLPGPTKSASKITETQDQIRARVQSDRKDAKQGDIFTPKIASYFHKQIASALKGPRGARILASLRRSEPTKIAVNINEPYPQEAPLQSMPPTLLMKLPKLPKELEYRIVGSNLILRDTEANLVVDILPDALPKA